MTYNHWGTEEDIPGLGRFICGIFKKADLYRGA
jgi:hypothetical protein